MKTSQLAFWGAVTVTAAASFIITSAISRSRSVAQTSALWTPYQISYRTFTATPNGQTILISDSIRAVRSDGATAQFSTFYHMDGAQDRVERILALPGGLRVRTDNSLGIMTATKNPAEDGIFSAAHRRDPAKSCMGSVGGGTASPKYTASEGDTFLGYSTWKMSANFGRYKSDMWRAPDLGCADMRIVDQKIDIATGAVLGTTETAAISIQPGTPDPSLFVLPSGLRNVSPSEMTSIQARTCCGKQLSSAELAPMTSTDEHFRQYRFDF